MSKPKAKQETIHSYPVIYSFKKKNLWGDSLNLKRR